MFLVAAVPCPPCSSLPKLGNSKKRKHQLDENRNAQVSIKTQIGYLISIFTLNYATLAFLMKECGTQKVIYGCVEEKRSTKGEK